MSSSAMEVFDRHVAAIEARDLDGVLATYAPDAILVDTNRIGRGHDHIRTVFTEVLDAAADLKPDSTVLEQDGVVYVSFRAARPWRPHLIGSDTFLIAGGLIVIHTGFNAEIGQGISVLV